MNSKLFILVMLAAMLLTGAGCISFGSSNKAAVGPMGVFRSFDKGDTWQQSNVFPTTQGVKSLAGVKVFRTIIDPSDPNAYYIATRGQGIFYTYNSGESWQMFDAMKTKSIYGLAVDPKNKCIIYVSDQERHIYKTIDCGRSWVTVYTDARPSEWATALAVDYGASDIIYAALVGGEVMKSVDGGLSWRVMRRVAANLQLVVADPLTPGRIYVVSKENGFTRSDDGGVTWEKNMSEGLQKYSESLAFHRLILNPAQRDSLFWLSKYGILRSDDAGKTWSPITLITAPGALNIYAFAINPKNQKEMYYVGTFLAENSSRSTFYKSTDGGNNWVTKKLPSTAIPIAINIHPNQDTMLLMAFTSL